MKMYNPQCNLFPPDAEGRTYLFDLDFNDINCIYSVDAAHYGNVAHFVNHSVNKFSLSKNKMTRLN